MIPNFNMMSDNEVWSACPIVFAFSHEAVHQMRIAGGVGVGWRLLRIAMLCLPFSTLHFLRVSDWLTESTFGKRIVESLVAEVWKDLFRLEAFDVYVTY